MDPTQNSTPNMAQGNLWGGLGDLFGAGMMGMFGQGQNPANSAMPYLNQIQGATAPYYQPYMNFGSGMLPGLQQQYQNNVGLGAGLNSTYGNLINNPTQIMNQIGSTYHQSPGYQWQLGQAMSQGDRAAAAGGMLGTPMHQQSNMTTATGLANQDYYNYLSHGLNMFGTGLQGEQGMYNAGLQGMQGGANMGYGASNAMGQNIANTLASQAQLAYQGAGAQNAQNQGLLGDMSGLISGGLGMIGSGGGLSGLLGLL